MTCIVRISFPSRTERMAYISCFPFFSFFFLGGWGGGGRGCRVGGGGGYRRVGNCTKFNIEAVGMEKLYKM